ncbi:MAG TPA: TetR/AcrR family transcriptional regulator [Streptosporangiaceae bacterium]|nr:TetR/AcrR family transcriptional regulator [Streptosporangiaceae bacterium]
MTERDSRRVADRFPRAERAGTRRRGVALEDALLDAAWAELREAGYSGFTMDGAAERAGTSRAVLYRRWRNKPGLVIAALRRHRPMLSGEVPDTGSLRGDVIALLGRASARLAELGPEVVCGLLGDYFADRESFAALHQDVLDIGGQAMASILKRAADRGEIGGDLPARVAAVPISLFRHELFVTRTPPGRQAIDEIVDQVFLPLARGTALR